MIIEDNDPPLQAFKLDQDTIYLSNGNYTVREFIGDRGQKYRLTPWPPEIEVNAGHSVDCAVPYVLPVLGLVLGGVVLILALGIWILQKIRPW